MLCQNSKNIFTSPTEGHWKFQGGGGGEAVNFFKKVWSETGISRGVGVQTQKTLYKGVGGGVYVYFLETHFQF